MQSGACRRTYDHRIRELAYQAGDLGVAQHLGIPKSTVANWMRRGLRDVVTLDPCERDSAELRADVVRLERRVRVLLAIVRLLFVVLRALKVSLEDERVPSGPSKVKLLDAIAHARRSLPVAFVLRILGLSPSRYHAWTARRADCPLDDRSTCPRSAPTQLTPQEIRTIHDMATSTEHRHMSVRALALHAQRLGRVFASAATWMKLIRERGWRRPRLQLHPPSPKQGIRATKPNEYWHLDVSIIRLLDGTRVYLHAVIDNFSRRILAWKAALSLEPQNTCAVLVEAAKTLPADNAPATIVADSGVENVNKDVDGLLGLGHLRRVLAQVEVTFSNSMIEAFWRSLKHNWLFLNQLDSFAAVERLVAFYVEQHNSVIPHAAFKGHTPDEVYFSKNRDLADRLAEQRLAARRARVEANRRLACADCAPECTVTTSGLQLRTEIARMS